MAKLCQIVTAGETSIMFFVLFLHVNSLQQIFKKTTTAHRDNTGGKGRDFIIFFRQPN